MKYEPKSGNDKASHGALLRHMLVCVMGVGGHPPLALDMATKILKHSNMAILAILTPPSQIGSSQNKSYIAGRGGAPDYGVITSCHDLTYIRV